MIVLRSVTGAALPLPIHRWLAEVDRADRTVLDRVRAPVLDVGCGPGRHVVALHRRGLPAMGVDVAPSAIRLARRRGALVLERSVFDRIPGTGRWRTVLLLDGNVGIGGDPAGLLRRVATLLGRAGTVVIEVDEHATGLAVHRMRVEADGGHGPWFPWAVVGADAVASIAGAGGFDVADVWSIDGRAFAMLERQQ